MNTAVINTPADRFKVFRRQLVRIIRLTHSEKPFPSKELGESSSRKLSEDVAIEEHSQDDALTRITLKSQVMTNKR